MDIVSGFVHFIDGFSSDPVLYSIILFLYSVAAAIFLPIPVEFALFLSPATPIEIKALVLGLGKMVGSMAVFYIGFELEGPIKRWSKRWKFFERFVAFCEWFVSKFGYVGFYVLLSIPFMSDTAVLYIFSLFNKDGKELKLKWFVVVNLLAGITRAFLVYQFADFFGFGEYI